MNTNELTINRLPSLTWFRLGVNDAKADISGLSERKAAPEITAPEGVIIRSMDAKEAPVCRIPEEAYVAGKSAILTDTDFPSGLGAQFVQYMGGGSIRCVEIPAGFKSDTPVVITIRHADGSDAKERLLFLVKEGADAKVILCSRGGAEAGSAQQEFVMTQVILEKDAKLDFSRVNLLAEDTVLLDDIGVCEAENARFTYRKADLGASKSYGGLSVWAAGENAQTEIETAYLKTGCQLLDMNYHIIHSGAKSVSRIRLKGVLAGEASKTFRGTIDFRKGCTGSDGDEREEVCLLDDAVVNKTVPVILCEEEDVDGRHGASIGRINEDELFYCESRGIDEAAARHLLVRGRLLSVTRKIPDEDLKTEISDRIRDELSGPGR